MKVWAEVVDGAVYSGIEMKDGVEGMTVEDWAINACQLAGGVLRVLARQYEWMVEEEGDGTEADLAEFICALADDARNVALTMKWHDPD